MNKKAKLIVSSMLAFILIFGVTLNYSEAASTSTSKVIASLKKQVNDLKSLIVKKDKQIKSLNGQITAKNKQINSLNAQITALKNQINPPSSPAKDVISKSDLPYTYSASNGMSLTINSYTVSTSEIIFNMTIKNNSTVSDKGDLMTSTWEVYDGKNTLKFIDQDRLFWDTDYLRAGQAVTGNVTFAGLSQATDTISLYGGLWQYIDKQEFKLKFKVE